MDVMFKKTLIEIDRKRETERDSCILAVLNKARTPAANLAIRAMLRIWPEIILDLLKTMIDVATKGPAAFLEGALKDSYKDLLKNHKDLARRFEELYLRITGDKRLLQQMYREAIEDVLKLREESTSKDFTSNFYSNLLDVDCPVTAKAIYFPGRGGYRVIIKGDCDCKPVRVAPFDDRKVTLGKWEVQAHGTVTPEVTITDNPLNVEVEFKVSRPELTTYATDPRPNCGCKERKPPALIDVTVNPQELKLEPGEFGTFTVSATDRTGGMPGIPVDLSAASVRGLVPVIAGDTEPLDFTLPGSVATFDFTVAKPRRDRSYPVRFLLITVDWVRLINGWGTVIVKNVAPEITGDVPGTDADPGAQMQLQNVSVTVVDDNADENNPGEVRVSSLTLDGQPKGLTTKRQFDGVDNPSKKSFEPSNGTYEFVFSRDGGKVERPHKHGEFITNVTVEDDNGETATAPVTLKVNDVPPSIDGVNVNPAFVHAGDEQWINITATFSDPNGWEDINQENTYIDATGIGGERYVLGVPICRLPARIRSPSQPRRFPSNIRPQ